MRSLLFRLWIGAGFALAACQPFLCADEAEQITQDQQAEILLNSARKAYNEKNYAFATGKFREFLTKFGNHKEAPAARYGLALTLIEGPDKKYEEARDLLQPLAANKEFGDRALAGYYAGIAIRGVGLADLDQAEAKPAEAAKYRASATARFNEAIPVLSSAITALLSKVNDPLDKAGKLTEEAEWVARARCDLAELQLRAGKWKDAQTGTAPFVADPLWSKSQYRNLGRYYHGYASVLLKDNATAQKTLAMLAPFNDPVFGTHARYLLARTHHLADERAEAMTHYEGTLAGYAASKAEAIKYLKTPQPKVDPEARARMEGLAKNPPPDHVARATFYLGVLLYEGGKFSDAKTRFAEFVKLYPKSPLKADAEIRIGYCQVQMRDYVEAVKTLGPLVDKDARLNDQAYFWLGKAQAGIADMPNTNPQSNQQLIAAAIASFKKGAEAAQKIAAEDPDAKARRGEILLEMADQMQRIWQNKEAAGVYTQLLSEKALPDREEEIMQRWTNALHLAGDYAEADKACLQFRERFPQSTLMPAVMFVYAENAYFRTVAAEKNPGQAKELPALFAETVKRLQHVIEKYPEYSKINVARYSLGLAYYRQGDLKAALATLSDIPLAERGGEVGMSSLLIADCILKQTPTTVPDDALAAGKMEEQLKSAAEALEAFIAQNGKDAHVPDALLKLGLCQQRMAGMTADPKERVRMYNVARSSYERIMRKDFGNHPLQMAYAAFERAKCIAQAGDINTGMNELRRFTVDPLKQTPAAPQAVLQLATYLRSKNQINEAVDLFAKNHDFLEGMLAKDAQTGPTLTALLRYHHGVALKEAGKLPEARGLFEACIKLGAQRPEAVEAALRIGQCLKEEGQQRLDTARKMRPSAKGPDQIAKVQAITDEGYKFIRDSVTYLETQADQIKTPALLDARARMLYDAAWGARLLAEPEIESAREAYQKEMLKKLNVSSAKFPLPEVPIEKLSLQPAEKRARGLYKKLIDEAGDTPIATEARFELAEMLAQRNEHDAAASLLTEVLDKEPALDMTEKIRLRLGGIFAAKGNIKGALQQFDAVASNAKSPLFGWAHYRAAEALIQDRQYPAAIKRLVIFRDQGQWQNVAGLSDRAMLRLGYAFALEKNWDQSRSAYERVINNFPNSPWQDEARYGMGWALQQQKNFDGAANVYSQVVARTATDLAAKAQLQIGLCRMEQKRYLDAANAFLVIPSTYDYPELRAAALLEAGKAYLELKQTEQANRQFERILREFPNTPWAEAAKEKLGQK